MNNKINDFDDSEDYLDDDALVLSAFQEQLKNIEKETVEEKRARLEKVRRETIRQTLTGTYSKNFVEAHLFSLLLCDQYFVKTDKERFPQDCFIDRRCNNALHYVFKPDSGGELSEVALFSLAVSLIDLEVMNCFVNPHQKNSLGQSPIDLCNDLDMLRELEFLTKRYRKDVYNKEEFQARIRKIEGVI